MWVLAQHIMVPLLETIIQVVTNIWMMENFLHKSSTKTKSNICLHFQLKNWEQILLVCRYSGLRCLSWKFEFKYSYEMESKQFWIFTTLENSRDPRNRPILIKAGAWKLSFTMPTFSFQMLHQNEAEACNRWVFLVWHYWQGSLSIKSTAICLKLNLVALSKK